MQPPRVDRVQVAVANDQSNPNDQPDSQLVKRVAHGRFLVLSLTGGSFAALLTLVGRGIEGWNEHSAFVCFVAAIPFLLIHILSTAPGFERRQHISCLMQAIVVLAGLVAWCGFVLMFFETSPAGAIVFGVSTVAAIAVLVQSSDRAKRKWPDEHNP